MKKVTGLIVVLLLIISLSACNKESMPNNETIKDSSTGTTTDSSADADTPADEDTPKKVADHQEITASEAIFDAGTMMRVSIPEVGLENLFICDASSYTDKRLDGYTSGQVYLLGDERGRGRWMMDHYLLIVINGKMIVKDLTAYDTHFNHGGSIELYDVDGDGDCEILLQQTVGMAGGAGSYLSRIFDYKDGQIIEMFTTDDIVEAYGRNCGFSITLHEGHKFTIKNEISGYSETFLLEDRNEEYFNYWYDKNGQISQREIMVDSYFEFLPADVDGDGVYEIVCRQYTSLIFHNDGIGYAKTVLKYNADTADFEIISAGFDSHD